MASATNVLKVPQKSPESSNGGAFSNDGSKLAYVSKAAMLWFLTIKMN